MSVTRVGAASFTNGSSPHTAAYAQSPTAGNLLVLAFHYQNATHLAITPPTGWTAGPQGGVWDALGYYEDIALFWKVATGGDAAPVYTTGLYTNAVVEEWAGLSLTPHDADSTVGLSSTTSGTGAGTCNSGPVTTTGAGWIWTYFAAKVDTSNSALTWGGGSASDSNAAWDVNDNGQQNTGNQQTAGAGTYTPTIAYVPVNTFYGGATASMAFKQLNSAPNAPTLNSPATGTTIDMGVTNRLAWTFSDPDAGDSQSAFDLQYRIGTGAWTPITQTTPNSFWDSVAGTFSAGSYEWQVRTYDSQGLVGPWSASSFFTAAATPGVPSITAPTSGSTISNTATVTWSVPAQTDYQVRTVADIAGAADTSTIYHDSGDVVDSTTRSVTLAFAVNNRWEHVQVRVKAAGLWGAWADDRVYVSWTAPMVPTIVVTTDPTTATMRVAITNPTPIGGAPTTAYNDVFVSSPLDAEYRAASPVAPNSTWIWWTPGAGRAYTIRAVAVGSNGTTATSDDMTVIDGGDPMFTTDITIDGGTP